MSTKHRDNCVVADDKNKPEIITYYNNTKSGVDILDKLVRTYSCKRATARWTVAFFFNLVDIAAYKLQRIGVVDYDESKLASRQVTRQGRLFLSELGMSLTNDHASERFTYHIGKRRRNQACARRSGSFPIDHHRQSDIIKEQRRWASATV